MGIKSVISNTADSYTADSYTDLTNDKEVNIQAPVVLDEVVEAKMRIATVKYFKSSSGYGFATTTNDNGKQEDLYFHAANYRSLKVDVGEIILPGARHRVKPKDAIRISFTEPERDLVYLEEKKKKVSIVRLDIPPEPKDRLLVDVVTNRRGQLQAQAWVFASGYEDLVKHLEKAFQKRCKEIAMMPRYTLTRRVVSSLPAVADPKTRSWITPQKVDHYLIFKGNDVAAMREAYQCDKECALRQNYSAWEYILLKNGAQVSEWPWA